MSQKRKAKPKGPKGVKIWILRDGEQLTIGEVIGDTFYKRLRGSQHFLNTPPMICTDVEALEQAQRAGASRMEVLDTETGVTYSVHNSVIWAEGLDLDRGYNAQIGLLLGRWHCDATKAYEGQQMEMELDDNK